MAEAAFEQLEQGVKRFGLRVAGTGGSMDGLELSDPRFHPFWAKAEELGVLVFIHPQGTAELELTSRGSGSAPPMATATCPRTPRAPMRCRRPLPTA